MTPRHIAIVLAACAATLATACKASDGPSCSIAAARQLDETLQASAGTAFSCACECDDPTGGAAFSTTLVGCASSRFFADRASDRQLICAEVCGGALCDAQSSCRIGSCRVPATASVQEHLACALPASTGRASSVAQYTITLDRDATTLTIGGMNALGGFSPAATSHGTGQIAVSRDGDRVQIMRLNLRFETLTLAGGALIRDPVLSTADRADGTVTGDHFSIAKGALTATVAGFHQDGPNLGVASAIVVNASAEGELKLDDDTFTWRLTGCSPWGGAIISLAGHITNHPPVLAASACRAAGGATTLVTDAHDVDANDGIERIQWFADETPVGSGARVDLASSATVQTYTVYAYDQQLAHTSATISALDLPACP